MNSRTDNQYQIKIRSSVTIEDVLNNNVPDDFTITKEQEAEVVLTPDWTNNNLKESNRIHGEDLQICSNKVSNLKSQTKDMEKDRTSLAAANARLSTTRKAIRKLRRSASTRTNRTTQKESARTVISATTTRSV